MLTTEQISSKNTEEAARAITAHLKYSGDLNACAIELYDRCYLIYQLGRSERCLFGQ